MGMIGSVLGWAALIILVLAELNHAAKQLMKKRRKRSTVSSLVMGKQHGVWGGLLLVIRVAAWCTGIGANHRVNNFDTWQWLGVVCVHLVSDRYLSDAQKNFPLAVLS